MNNTDLNNFWVGEIDKHQPSILLLDGRFLVNVKNDSNLFRSLKYSTFMNEKMLGEKSSMLKIRLVTFGNNFLLIFLPYWDNLWETLN